MKERVFLDSGIFIALLNRRDRWHEHACALFNNAPPAWHTSWLVCSETYSWFLHRMGEETARNFRSFFEALPKLSLFDVTAAHHRHVAAVLERYRGTKLTYVDASSLAFIERKKIRTVWSTDHHLGLTGATIFPRS